MYIKSINGLHTKLLKEALKSIREIEHKECSAPLSRQLQISHLKAKEIHCLLLF